MEDDLKKERKKKDDIKQNLFLIPLKFRLSKIFGFLFWYRKIYFIVSRIILLRSYIQWMFLTIRFLIYSMNVSNNSFSYCVLEEMVMDVFNLKRNLFKFVVCTR
jgi:hypothetical protein